MQREPVAGDPNRVLVTFETGHKFGFSDKGKATRFIKRVKAGTSNYSKMLGYCKA